MTPERFAEEMAGPGQLIIHERSVDRRFEIVRADRSVFISNSLIAALERGPLHPDVSFGDHILTIRGINRTVSYGLVEYELLGDRWYATKSPEPADSLLPPNHVD